MLGAPHADTTSDLADWLELRLLTGDAWRVTETNARGEVESAGLIDAFGGLVAGAIMKMQRRASTLRSSYPFEDTPAGLRRATLRDRHLPYVALLGLSQWHVVHVDGSAMQPAASEFEQLCESIVRNLGGPGGQSLHFGWPSRSGRPERFPDAIRWLADKLGLRSGEGFRDPRRRDGGVDLVTWRSLPDGASYDHRLVQCTLGRDLLGKAREIDVRQWRRWIGFIDDPRVVLAVPYEVSSRDVAVREAQSMGSMVLDRAQLVRTADPEAALVQRSARRSLETVGLRLAFESPEGRRKSVGPSTESNP